MPKKVKVSKTYYIVTAGVTGAVTVYEWKVNYKPYDRRNISRKITLHDVTNVSYDLTSPDLQNFFRQPSLRDRSCQDVTSVGPKM